MMCQVIIRNMCCSGQIDILLSIIQKTIHDRFESQNTEQFTDPNQIFSESESKLYRVFYEKIDEALPFACGYGYIDIADYILTNSPTINPIYAESILIDSCTYNRCDIIELFLNHRTKFNQNIFDEGLIAACSFNNFDCVKILVENGVDIHNNCDYPLRTAFSNRNLEIVVYLIKQGANYNSDNKKLVNDVDNRYNFKSDVILDQLCKSNAIHRDKTR